MSKIHKIESKKTRPILTPKNTGYAATGALLVTTLRAFNKSNTITKSHKIWGLVTAGLTLLHVGVVEYLRYKYKKM